MIGIIKGNILDAQGRPIVPGKPVTITGVRSDGGDDISVITEPDGTWSFNLTSEKVGECDITFMYNGLEVGSYEVFFVDDLNLTVLPYSSSETHQGHSALIAFAVTDPDGKGVPNAPVTFYDDSSDPNPTATVNTDRFGIVEFLVSPTTESGSLALGPRRFNATIGKTIATHTVEWTTDSKSLTYAISDFMYTDEVEPGGRAVLGGYLLDQNGEVIIQPYNFDIFSKDKLSIISSNFYQDPDGRIIMAPNDQGEGSHRLCFFSDNGRKDVTVTWQDQVSDVIDTVRLTAPDAHVYPTVVDTYVKAIAYNADGEVVKVRNELKFNNTINGSSKSFGIILPDGSLVINAQSDTTKTQRQGVMIDGVSKLDHEFEYRDGLTISKCEYGNDAVPTGQDGFVAFVVTGTDGKAVPAAAVDYIESSGKRHYTNTPVDGNHILEVPISQGGDENRTYEEITAIVGESKAVAGVYWKPESVPVGLTLRDVVFPTQSKDNVAMTITGVLNDQNGAPIKDTKLGIFNVSTLEYQEFGENGAIGDDGSFNINYGPLPIGDHELILAANAVAEHHDTTWIDSVPVFESFRALPWMTESTPEGTEDLIGVAAITADGETAAGVPVTFYRSDFYEVEGEELGTVMTNEYGFAELKVTVDTPLTEAFETVYYLAKYKDKQLRLNYTRSNVRPSVMELANFTINEKTQVGKSAVVKCTAVDKLGTPVSSLQGMHVYHLPSFKAMSVSSPDYVYNGTAVYNVETAETFGDFQMGVGTHPMVMYHRQSNSRVYFDLVVVDEADVVTPAKIVLTADAPTVGMVNDSGYFPVMAQAQDADGNPFKPAYGIQVAVHRKMDGVDYNGGYAHIGPNGEVYSAVTPNEAGDYTFWFEDQEYEGDAGENYGEFGLTFRDDLLVEMSKATTETVTHGEQATLVARAMNQVHQGVANVWVDFYSEEMYGNISGGTTDHLGYATGKVSEAYVISITDPEIVTIKAKLIDIVESEESIVVTWDGDAKQVVLSDVVIPETALPNKPVAVTGNVQDKDGNLLEGIVVTVTDKLTGIDYVSTPTIGGSFRLDVNMAAEGDHELIVSAGGDLVYGTVKVELVIPAYDSVEKLPFSTTRAANDGSVFLAFKATNVGTDVVDLPLDLYIQGAAQPIRGTYTDARGYGVLLFNSTEPNSTVMLEVKVGTTVIGVYEVSFTDQPVGSAITEVLNIEPTVNGEAMLFDITVTDQNDAVIANPVIGAFDFTNFTPLTITPDANQHGRGLYTIEGMTDASIEVMIYTENARTQVNSSWVDEPLKEYTAIAIDAHSANPSEGEEVELTGHLLSADDQIVVPNSVVVAKLVDTEGGETLSTIDTEGKFLFPLSYAEYTKKTYTVHVGAVVSESFDIEWGHLVPPEYTSIVWVGEQPSTGEVGTPVKLEAMTLDQYGNPIEGVSVRPFINGVPGDAFRSPPGGKWSFDYNATVAGNVTYEFGWEPDIARISHTVTWSIPVASIESLRYSDSNAVPGTDAFAAFGALSASGEGIEGVDISLTLDSPDGEVYQTVTTDEYGIAEFTIPQDGANSSRLVYAKSGDVVKERRQWWANTPEAPATDFANFTVTSPVPNGERAMVSVQAVSNTGDPRPLASIGIFDRNTLDQIAVNKVATGESKSFLLDFAGTGTGNYVLVTDAGRKDFTVVWDNSVKTNPDGVVLDATSPDTILMNEWTELTGTLTENGASATNLNSYVKPTVTVEGTDYYLDLNLDTGKFSVMVKGTVEGDASYDFKLDDAVVLSKTYKQVDTLTLNDMAVLTTVSPKVYSDAELGVMVKDGAGNSLPGVNVVWTVTGDNNALAITKSDEFGIATINLPYRTGVSTAEVTASVGSVTSATTITWKPSNEPSDVGFETLTVDNEIYDLEKATVTGKVINQANEGIATTKFDVYDRNLGTHTSHAADVQSDGTFTFEMGPYSVGTHQFYFCINGKREEREITVIERTPATLTKLELDPNNPISGNAGETLTINGTGYDQYGAVSPNSEVQWSIGTTVQTPVTTDAEGKFSVDVNSEENGPVVYSFGGNNGIPELEHTIAWSMANFYTLGFTGPTHDIRQEGSAARIEVFLSDNKGVGIPNASVKLTDKATGATLTTMTTNSRGTANYNVTYNSSNKNRTFVATYDTLTVEHDVAWVPSTTKFAAGFTNLYLDTRIASGKQSTIRGKLADQDGNPIAAAGKVGVFNSVTLETIDITDRVQPDGSFEFEYGPVADGTYSTFVYTDGGYQSAVLIWSTSNTDVKRVVYDDNIPRMAPSNGRVTLHGTLVDSDGNKVNPKYNTSCTAYGDGGETFTGSMSTDGTWSVEVYFADFRAHAIDIVNSNNGWMGQYSLIVTDGNILTELPYSSNVATVGQAATMAVRVTDQSELPVEGAEITAHVGSPDSPAVVTGTTNAMGNVSLLVPSPAESGEAMVYFKNGESVLDAKVDWKPVDVLVGRTFQDVIVPEFVDFGKAANVSGKLLDQNGDVLLGRNPQVYHVNGNNILNTTLTKNDETGFELQIAALPSGTHQLVLFVGNAETYEEITWEVQIPTIGKLTAAAFSSTKVPVGDDATAYFYVSAVNGAPLPDVPVKVYWTNASGQMIDKVTSDATGLVTVTIPGKDGEVNRTGTHTVYATVSDKSATLTMEWVDGELVGSTMTRVDSMDVVVSGEKFLARMSVKDQNGEPMVDPKIVYYEPRIQVVRPFTIVDYPSDDIVIECSVGLLNSTVMAIGTDNAASFIPIDWDDTATLIAPVTAKVAPELPAINPVNEDLIIKGKVLDTDGLEFRPTTILKLTAVRTDTNAEVAITVMPDGEWAFVANEPTAGDVTYNLMYGTTQLSTFTVKFGDAPGAEAITFDEEVLPLAIEGGVATISGTTFVPEVPAAESITLDEVELPLGTTTGTTTISGTAS